MPSYKLTYFDARARGEMSRLLFVIAGVDFEDNRISFQDWPKIKDSTPFGHVPVLEVDGKKYSESLAIATYLAKEFGLNGKTNGDALEILQIACVQQDMFNAFTKGFFEKDEAKKAEMMKKYQEEDIPKNFQKFEEIIKSNGTGYFVGNSITFADIIIWDFLFTLNKHFEGCYDKYPGLKALCEKVANESKIKAYVAKRKDSAL